jgi:signal peptidase II
MTEPARVDASSEAEGAAPEDAAQTPVAAPSPVAGPSRRRWVLFAGLAGAIIALDQVTKALVVANLEEGERVAVLGEFLQIVHWRNTGAIFGLVPDSAPIFAAVSLVVIGLIVWYHAKAGSGLLMTVALGALLGGAIGNLIDRLRFGGVVDFVDAGIGTFRWYTFNIADAGISIAIVLLLAMALVPRLAQVGTDA